MFQLLFLIPILLFILFILEVREREPSLDLDWKDEVARTAHIDISGDTVVVHNVRQFRHNESEVVDKSWSTRSYDLRQLDSLWFIKEKISPLKAAAHTFISFGFADGNFLTVSIEARFEKGETYSLWRGMFNKFELVYIWADEQDAIHRRTCYLDEDVFLYKVIVEDKSHIKDIFLDYAQTTNQLARQAQFYNTLTNNCTNRIARHINNAQHKKSIPYRLGVLFPGWSDSLLARLHYIEADTTKPNWQQHHNIKKVSNATGPTMEYSTKIRHLL